MEVTRKRSSGVLGHTTISLPTRLLYETFWSPHFLR